MSNEITSNNIAIPTTAEIDDYLANLPAPTGDGRLIFGLDATASRQGTWDMASALQAEMFQEASDLYIQLIYYRGDECKASPWMTDARRLGKLMRRITCESGATQIGRVLAHARRENNQRNISALVFVGDAMEEEPEELYTKARALHRPVFMFQEGDDPDTEKAFRQIARITKGAYAKFAPGAADKFGELLRAVAAYAAGGQALAAKEVRLIEQMK